MKKDSPLAYSGFLIDWFVISIVQTIAMFLLNFIPQYKEWFAGYPALEGRVWFFVMVFLVFMLLPKLTNGETIGKKVVRIQVVEEGHEKIRFKALLIRYGYLYVVYGLISSYMTSASDLLNSNNRMLQLVSFMLFLFCSLLLLLFFINVFYVLIRKKRRLFYEKASHTYTISTIKEKKNTENQ